MGLFKFKFYYLLIATINGVYAMAMPLYYDTLSYSTVQVGILISLPSVVMLLQPFWGIIVDKFQKPKLIAITGLLGSSFVLLNLMWAKSFHTVFFIVFIYSFIRMPVWSTVDNIIVTYCMNNQRSYGTIRVFASIAWGCSLLVFFPIVSIFGFKSYFIVALIVSIVLSVLIYNFPSELSLIDKQDTKEIEFSHSLKILLQDRGFHYIVLFTLFFSAMFTSNLVYQNLYLEELGATAFVIAAITFVGIIPEFFILPLIERYIYKLNNIVWMMIVVVIFFVRFIGLAFFASIPSIAVIALLHGIGMSFYIPVFIKHLKNAVPNQVSTTAITINGFMAAISGIFMSILAGYLRGVYGIGAVYFINSLAMILAFLVLILYYRYDCKNKESLHF